MDNENRKIVALIVFFRNFISAFFTLFFNIYVLKIVNDVGIIIKYNLVGVIFDGLFSMVIAKCLSSKNAKKIYNFSFILLMICILLLMTLKNNICNYLYLFRILYSLTKASYYVPYEFVVMGANNHKTMSSFLANIKILGYIATIFTPVLSGFIIERFSYYMLFVTLSIEAFLIIVLSSKIKSFYVTDKKVNLKEFVIKKKNYPHLSNIYKCMFFRRISLQGAVTDLLPILLFLKTGSELRIGGFNTFFAILSITSLSILKILNKKNIKKHFYVLFAFLIFLSSLFLVLNVSFVSLLIYYILLNSLGTIIESESCSVLYESINVDDLNQYKREHHIFFDIYMLIGQSISYSFALILYQYFYSANILTIAICIMMFFSTLSGYYLEKTMSVLN